VLSPDGDRRQIIDSRGSSESILSIAWAPDGERLAAVRLSSAGSRVVVVDLDGRISYLSGDDQAEGPVAWTTDGQVIYVAGSWDKADGHPHDRVRLVSSSGGEPTTMWEGRNTTFGVVGVAGLPDGRVMFLGDEGLMVVNRDGTDVHALTPVGMTPGEPDAPALPRASVRNFALSPDGSRVATVAGGELAMVDVASGAKLARTAASVPAVVEWSADSRRVGFAGGIVLADDGQVTHTGGDDVAFQLPIWRPGEAGLRGRRRDAHCRARAQLPPPRPG
jgi:WD40 repeat protein